MDAITATSSMRPATPHAQSQKNRHVLVRSPVRMSNPLQRYINIAEHTTTPGSWHCKYCHSVLTTSRTFKEHINRCHTKDVLFLCNDGNCDYQCFSFLSLCGHDRRYHGSRRFFSVGFRRSEIIQYQPTLYEIVAFSKRQEGRCQWFWENNHQVYRHLPDGSQTWANSGPPVSYIRRPESTSWTPLSSLPDQDEEGTDSACEGVEEDQARESNGSLLAQEQQLGNIGSPPPSGQGAQSSDKACPVFEPTDDFRDIYHIFKHKLDTLQLDPNLNG